MAPGTPVGVVSGVGRQQAGVRQWQDTSSQRCRSSGNGRRRSGRDVKGVDLSVDSEET
jgi:hypothetical protein